MEKKEAIKNPNVEKKSNNKSGYLLGDCSRFLSKIDIYSKVNPEFRILMRRSAGKTVSDADSNTLLGFYRNYYGKESEENKYFFSACVHCLWDIKDHNRMFSLPEAVKEMDKGSASSFEKRLLRLLEMHWDNDGFILNKMFHLVRFCKSKGIRIDCAKLLADILCWDKDNGAYIRKKWAREYNLANKFKD